ncbi:MAG: hypothetical protein QXF25_03130, partial [Candidatus Pacearchaeota archaeon]
LGKDNKNSKSKNKPANLTDESKNKINKFRELYEKYKKAREILEQGKRTGGLYFNNPDVYDKLLQKAQEIHKLFGRENATFERDVENGTEIDYLHNQDMWRIILAWYSGSREKLGKFLEKDDNLESIISGINPENLKEFISNTRPPKNITKEYEDLGNLHNLHKSYYDLSNLVRSYEEAGTNGQRGQISKISQAIKLSAIKIIEEKEKRIKDPEVKAFAGFFKRLASRSTSYALRDVVLPKLQNLKEEFDKELNDNDKKVRCYFEIMANEMKGEIGNSNDALFDILYALTQK